MEMILNAAAPNVGEQDMSTLDAEISELQRENQRVETQMLRLKSDISAMESHLHHIPERVRHVFKRTGWLKQKISCNFKFYCVTRLKRYSLKQ